MSHEVRWLAPAPLWHGLVGDGSDQPLMRRPALLRFASDTFMEDLGHVLDRDPPDLATALAAPVSYRPRPPKHPGPWPPLDMPLKLFQPAHGHFNLVAATLACALPGLPEHEVDAVAQERAAFVMRRLGPDGAEEAWTSRSWLPLTGSAAAGLAAGEELMPLVPVPFSRDGRPGRLLVGLIPTASLDTTAPGAATGLVQDPDQGPSLPGDARVQELRRRVLDAQRLIEEAAVLAGEPEARLVEPSRFVLLDLAVFLDANLPRVWAALSAGSRAGLGAVEAAVYDALEGARPDAARLGITWRGAAVAAWEQRLAILGEAAGPATLDVTVVRSTLDNDAFWARVRDALPPLPPGGPPPPTDGTSASQLRGPKIEPRGTARYVVRCVYRRPLCGLLRPDLVSPPSEPFRIAPFFDLDAPGRPVQIALPFPSGIKDLRRFPHNVSMLISDELRQQLSRVRDAKKVLDGDPEEPIPFGLGVVCSFSIPIITICALVLLLLIVGLLNIVFWWMPFFRICLPLRLGSGS